MSQIKLKQVLENNRKWPLVIAGSSADDFDGVVLSARSGEKELYKNGLYTPVWISALESEGADMLVIEGLDEISPDEQENFISLLKDRRAGTYKVSDHVQIVIPVKEKEKLSSKIQSLTIPWVMK